MSEVNFRAYAKYYDLLYQDKDYAAETKFVRLSLQRYASSIRSLLELGCGSGKHARHFVNLGHTLHGIDRSPEMIELAIEMAATLDTGVAQRITFEVADIREFREERRYDVVLSLFHVMSYQTANEDLVRAFKTAYCHLQRGGLFAFDCWYGPAVLICKPEARIKQVGNEYSSITRFCEPHLRPNTNCVDVKYTIIARDVSDGYTHYIEETHKMRYLFVSEIQFICEALGFELVHQSKWLSDNALGSDSWNGYFICRKVG